MSRPKSNRQRRGRNEGGLRKNSRGLWEASLSLGRRADGKRHRLTATGSTKKEALDKLAEMKQQPMVAGDNVTISAYSTQWLKGKARKRAESTVERYTDLINKFVAPYLGHIRVKDLSAPHVADWFDRMSDDGVTVGNQSRAATVLHGIYVAAMKAAIAVGNPVSVVDRPQVPKAKSTVLSLEQIKAFLEAADSDRMFALWNLALATGLRAGELLGLHWSDFDFDQCTLTISRTWIRGKNRTKEPKTEASKRTIPLAGFAVDAMLEHQKQRLVEGLSGCEITFPTKRGNYMALSGLHVYHFKPTLLRAGLPKTIRIHDLRHTAATWLLYHGASPSDVSAILGHCNTAFTMSQYVHALKPGQVKAIDAFGVALGKSSQMADIGGFQTPASGAKKRKTPANAG